MFKITPLSSKSGPSGSGNQKPTKRVLVSKEVKRNGVFLASEESKRKHKCSGSQKPKRRSVQQEPDFGLSNVVNDHANHHANSETVSESLGVE